MTQGTDTNYMGDDRAAFRTKDLNQAAFIWCQPDAKLDRLEAGTGRGTTIFFLFSLRLQEQDLAALIIKYANGDTLVDPLAFAQNQSKLRDLLHSSLGRRRKGDDNAAG
jgi:hypothetical protein